jgi:hypothetical protein
LQRYDRRKFGQRLLFAIQLTLLLLDLLLRLAKPFAGFLFAFGHGFSHLLLPNV